MNSFVDTVKGKRVTLMGLGLLGRGVGDARFLAECGAMVTVTDRKDRSELKESVDALSDCKNISFVLGGHRFEDFRTADLIIQGAGVPLDSPYIAEARKHGVPVRMSSALFAEFSPATVIGVTGTRGKSTVSHLIYHILREAGRDVFLGGNAVQLSTLAHLPESTQDEIAVLELDSWQLQGFGESEISPDVAVFTTFMPDHLNYYHGDEERYLNDKAHIFNYQSEEGILILGSQCARHVRDRFPDIRSSVTIARPVDVPKSWDVPLPGAHNIYNTACAAEATRALGVTEEIVRKAVESFPGIPGRLEKVAERDGVAFYNDTTSTTPHAVQAALDTLGTERTVLIFGGSDKDIAYPEEALSAVARVRHLVLLPGTGTDRVRAALEERRGERLTSVESMEDAVKRAVDGAHQGDTVLLSPGFASFGPPPGGFKNEFERGERFMEAVRQLRG